MLKDKLLSQLAHLIDPMKKIADNALLHADTVDLLSSLNHNRKRRLRIKLAIGASAVAAFMLVLIVWSVVGTNEGKHKGEANAAIKRSVEAEVSVVSLRQGPLYKEYSSMGTLNAMNLARILPKVSGRILSIQAAEGDEVSAGQLLMVINPSDYQINVQNAQALVRAANVMVDKSRRDYERALKLHEVSAIAEASYQDARSAYDNARASLEQARAGLASAYKTLSECHIKAPISGVITQCFGNVGELTGPQTPMPVFTIEQMGDIKMEVDLPEESFSYLTEGSKSAVSVDAISGRLFEGRISKIFPTINQLSKTYRVTIALDNTDMLLRSGMTARAKFVMKVRDNVVTAPKEALLPEDSGYYAYKVLGTMARKVRVATGIEGDNMIEIKDGLHHGDRVVTVGVSGIHDGSPVIVRAEQDLLVPDFEADSPGGKPVDQAGKAPAAKSGGALLPNVAPGLRSGTETHS